MARAGMRLEDQIDRLLNPKLQPPRLKLLGRRGKLRIYMVDDTAVRLMYPDWTSGGHDQIYFRFIPPLEVWISRELCEPRPPLEKNLCILHELRERRRMIVLMRGGMSRRDAYNKAHDESLVVEDKYRRAKGRGLATALRRERGQ